MKPLPFRIYLIRISLFLALLSALTVCSLNFIKVKQRIVSLDANLKQQISKRLKVEAELVKTAAKLKTTAIELEASKQETVQAVAEARAESKRAGELTGALAASNRERDRARADLARFHATGMEPEQIVHAASELKNLRVALAISQQQETLLEQKLRIQCEQIEGGSDILLPADLKTKVLLYDPKWRFVVLDTGSEQGMVKNAELLAGRDGKLVGKVKISRVQKGQSVGNLISGWQLGEMAEGDYAIPAHPES